MGRQGIFQWILLLWEFSCTSQLSVLESWSQHWTDWRIDSAFKLASWVLTLLRLTERPLLVQIILVSINLSDSNLCFLFPGWTMGWQLVDLFWYEPFSRYYSENGVDECWTKKNCVFFFSCRYLYNVSLEERNNVLWFEIYFYLVKFTLYFKIHTRE